MYGKTKNSAILNYDNNYYSNSPFIDNITLKKTLQLYTTKYIVMYYSTDVGFSVLETYLRIRMNAKITT